MTKKTNEVVMKRKRAVGARRKIRRRLLAQDELSAARRLRLRQIAEELMTMPEAKQTLPDALRSDVLRLCLVEESNDAQAGARYGISRQSVTEQRQKWFDQ